jgi:peroxiredoxin (alkyl hydroperoxide reductase subunit C)
MLTVGDKISDFEVFGVSPAILEDGTFVETLTQDSFEGKWKVVVFYPKDFTFVCPTEIIEYDKLFDDFDSRGAVLLFGSTDNEFSKMAWKDAHPGLKNLRSWMFADTHRREWDGSLADGLGIFHSSGVCLRATFIIDPENVIQHVTVNGLDTGRNPAETLRVLDAIQTGELTACSRPIGGATL